MTGQISSGIPSQAPPGQSGRGGWIKRLVQAVVILPFMAFLAMAVSFQFDGGLRVLLLALVAAATATLLWLWWAGRGRLLWAACLGIFAASALWWSSIRPSNEGEWQPDVARGVTATINGNSVTLHDVRNFDWVSDSDFASPARWEDRSYPLDQLTGVDLFTSVWGNPNIAHVMVGFGFADGRHVVFSAETRKRAGQEYSTVGGFFKLYTLVLIAADERDAIRWRTDVRAHPPEVVSLFPVQITPANRRALFLDFLALGNRLAARPEFYNTATTNCTTVPWRLARRIAPDLPLDWRVLLSAHLPEYLHRLGAIAPGEPWGAVAARARLPVIGPAGDDSVAFSRRLRAEQAAAD